MNSLKHPMTQEGNQDLSEQVTALAQLGEPNTAKPELPDVLAVIGEHFKPDIVLATEACISAICSLLLADVEGCVALVLEGPASSGKTTTLNFLDSEALRDKGLVWVSDKFTPASFVSHAANRPAEELAKIDLLPNIQHKTFIVPDLAPTFSVHAEDLANNVGVLTRVLDGQGYESDSGTHGHRGYTGDYRFTLAAATTPLDSAAWRAMGRVGNRILMLETGCEPVTAGDLVADAMSKSTYQQKAREIQEVVSRFLIALWDNTGGYGKVSRDTHSDDPDLVSAIAQVAHWVVRCRGTVTMQTDGFTEGSHSSPVIEAPHRLFNGLLNLAKGHAIACGRRKLDKEDVQIAVRVGLDSMPFDRRRVIRALLRSREGKLSSAEVEQAMGQSRPTARNAMETLAALGAVESGQDGKSKTTSLLDSERWLLEGGRHWALARLP